MVGNSNTSVSYSAYQPSGQLGSKLEHVIITFQKNEIPLFGRAVEVVGWQSIFIVILCTLKQIKVNKSQVCPAAEKKKTAAGQANSSCPNALSSGGFDSKPPFLYPLAAHRRMPPCDYGEIGTCQKKSNHRSGTLHPGLRK